MGNNKSLTLVYINIDEAEVSTLLYDTK
jgi:hypothetical protein